MKTTILGGLIFLAPIAIIIFILGKAFQLSLLVAAPVDKLIPVSHVGGIALVNMIAIAVIVLICYLAGLLARSQFLGNRLHKVDGLLMDVIPTYAVFKGVVGSMAQKEDITKIMKPVSVQFDDYEQIAFEMERNAGRVVLFLPGAPSAWAGSSVIVDETRVHALNVPTYQAVKLMRVFGRGSLAMSVRDAPGTTTGPSSPDVKHDDMAPRPE
ncbi:MAG: hypothetical protein ABJL72_15160 [Roseobacter sp.]